MMEDEIGYYEIRKKQGSKKCNFWIPSPSDNAIPVIIAV